MTPGQVTMDHELRLRGWLRGTLIALFVVFAMLLGTGVWLILNYRPPLTGPPLDDQSVWMSHWVLRVRSVHRFAGWLALVLGVALFVEAASDAVWRRRVRIALPAIPVPAVVVTALLSGWLLPFTRVGLWSVTTADRSDRSGYAVVARSSARFFVVDGEQLTATEIRRWFWLHTTAAPVVLLGLLVVTTVLVARTRPALASPAGTDVDVTGS